MFVLVRRAHRAVRARVVAVSSAVAVMMCVSLGSPAVAAPSYNWRDADLSVVQGQFSFGSIGAIAGHPGQVHSGFLKIQTDEDNITGALWDWTCPSGVLKPTLSAPKGCDLLKEVTFASGPRPGPSFIDRFTTALRGSFTTKDLRFTSSRRQFDRPADLSFQPPKLGSGGSGTGYQYLPDGTVITRSSEQGVVPIGTIGPVTLAQQGYSWVREDSDYHRDSYFYPDPK